MGHIRYVFYPFVIDISDLFLAFVIGVIIQPLSCIKLYDEEKQFTASYVRDIEFAKLTSIFSIIAVLVCTSYLSASLHN